MDYELKHSGTGYKNNIVESKFSPCREAIKVVEDRQAKYGKPENNFLRIAKLWGDYLGVPISPTDVGMLMILLKIARNKTGLPQRDTLVDIAGYAEANADLLLLHEDDKGY